MIRRLSLYRISIPFKQAFKHHSAERAETDTVWVEAESDDGRGCGEGCPRKYVTGASVDARTAYFERHPSVLRQSVNSLEDLRRWMAEHQSEIAANPAAWCAIELAILELLAWQQGIPVEGILSLPAPSARFRYSAVIGDGPEEQFRATVSRCAAMGFSDFKIKLSGDPARDREKVAILSSQAIPGLRLRADANNLWPDAETAIRALNYLECAFAGIEEPIVAEQFDAMRRIAQETGSPIILDESLLGSGQIPLLAADPKNWIINIRVSKMGGLLRSLDVVDRAREAGISVTVGAHVGETSLLTRAGLTVAQAAGEVLFAQEGAFGTFLLEADVVENPLMFGRAGILDTQPWNFAQKPGWGLTLSRSTAVQIALRVS